MNDKKNAKPKKKKTFFSNTIVHNQNWKKKSNPAYQKFSRYDTNNKFPW